MSDNQLVTVDRDSIDVYTVMLNVFNAKYYILCLALLAFILTFLYNQYYLKEYTNVSLLIKPSNETQLKIGRYDSKLLVDNGFTKDYLIGLYISKVFNESLLMKNINISNINLKELNENILESVYKGSYDYSNSILQFSISIDDLELFKKIIEVHLVETQKSVNADVLNYYISLSDSIKRKMSNLRRNHEFNVRRNLGLIEHEKENILLSSENEINDIIFYIEANKDLAIKLGYEDPTLDLIQDQSLDQYYNVDENNFASNQDRDRFNLLKRFTALSQSETPLYFFGYNILNAELDHIKKNKEFLINSSVNKQNVDEKLITLTLNDTFIEGMPLLNQELTEIETFRNTLDIKLFNNMKYNFIEYDLKNMLFNRVGISPINMYLISILIGGSLGLIIGLFMQEFMRRRDL